MKTKKELITTGFIFSGLMNIFGVLIFSRVFTNSIIQEFDKQAMSNFGLVMIVVWGMAYISVSKSFYKVKWLIGVFAVEKFIYATHWTNWLLNNSLSDVFEKDKMAGLFYTIYGVNDWIFFIFFLLVFIHLIRAKENN
jgi:hypothetical protein